MKILGIDQSLTETGFCILNNGKRDTSGIIKLNSKIIPEKINYIIEQLKDILSNDSINYITREGFSYGSVNQAFKLGGLGLAIDCAFYKNNFYIIPPSLLKKFITGNGNSKKDQMMLQTYKKYNIEFKNNNECDAFGLAMFLYKFLLWNKGLKQLKYEEDCFKKFSKIEQYGISNNTNLD